MNEKLTMLDLIREHALNIRPKNKPTRERIAAAGKLATLSNSQVSQFKVRMEYARIAGKKPLIPELEA